MSIHQYRLLQEDDVNFKISHLHLFVIVYAHYFVGGIVILTCAAVWPGFLAGFSKACKEKHLVK